MNKTLRKFVGPVAGSIFLGLGLAAAPASAQTEDLSPGVCTVFANDHGGTTIISEANRAEFRRARVSVRRNDNWVTTIAPGPYRFRQILDREVRDVAGSPEDNWSIRIWRNGNAYEAQCSVQEQDTTPPVIVDPGTLEHQITPVDHGEGFAIPEFALESFDPEGGPVTFTTNNSDWEKIGLSNVQLPEDGRILFDKDSPLEPGTYEPVVTARDFQGNETSLQLKIVITPQA